MRAPRRFIKDEVLGARRLNEMLDYITAEQGPHAIPGRSIRENEIVTAVYVKNASGGDAPSGACVSITGRTAGGVRILAFDQPGDAPYAVTLMPIPNAALGLVCVGGGVFELLVDSGATPSVGDVLAAQSGEWDVVVGSGPFVALSNKSDDKCFARLSGGGSGYDAIQFVITTLSSGDAFGTGFAGFLEVPFACTIIACRMVANESTTTVVDIWLDTYGNAPPTNADSITAAAVPTISAALKSADTTLTGWSPAIPAGSWLGFNVDANDNAENLTISLTVTR